MASLKVSISRRTDSECLQTDTCLTLITGQTQINGSCKLHLQLKTDHLTGIKRLKLRR